MSCKVAIITRTKDRPFLLRRAFASVANQRFSDWEHVIVNDGGDRDAVDAIIAEFPDAVRGRIKVVHHETSKGMQPASNAGVEASSGELICIHDDDDQWHPEFLEKAVSFLENEGPNSPFRGVITATEEVLELIDQAGTVSEVSRRPYIPLDEISLFRLGYENPFPPIAFCFRRSAWEELGGFDPRWDVIGDMDFNLRFLRKFEIGVIPEALAFYHIREESDDPASANSIREKQALHKRLFTELKNTHLREAETVADGALSVSLNTAGYLVEAQWILHDVYHRSRQNQEAIDTLSRSIALDGYEDRFKTLREALAILIDHARDTGMRTDLKGLRSDMAEQIKAREAFAQRLEELIRSTGLPAENDAVPTIRQALNILVEHARNPQVANQLEHISEQLKEAALNRHKTADRLEELIRSVGLLSPEKAEANDNILNKLTQLVDFTRDPGRNGQAAREEVRHALSEQVNKINSFGERIEGRLSALEERHSSANETVSQKLHSLSEENGAHIRELGSQLTALEARQTSQWQETLAHVNANVEAIEKRLLALEESVDASRRKFWEFRIGRFSLSASSDRRNRDSESE